MSIERQQQKLFRRWVSLRLRSERSSAARAELGDVAQAYLHTEYPRQPWRLAEQLQEASYALNGEERPPRVLAMAASSGNGRPKTRRKGTSARVEQTLVEDVVRFIRRYVVMSRSQTLLVALWAIHTHCIEAFEQTPYLAVTSPEKQSGKSRLLESLELIVARAWMTVLPSEAVVYRTVDRNVPTLLLDEVDAIFNPRTADRYEGLRALLNAGHRRGAKIPRCVGATQQIAEFSVFCPKVIAGIGTLPDTVADRSLPVRLERRKSGEQVGRFIRREVEPDATALRSRMETWAGQSAKKLRRARPAMPEQLSDRMQEGCEGLVAIADALGCGKEARVALVDILCVERLDNVETMRIRVLADLRTIWRERESNNGRSARGLPTSTLLAKLCGMEEAPWGSYYGRQLEARDLAALLHHYGISSTTIRTRKEVAKGYRRDDLQEAWERYLP